MPVTPTLAPFPTRILFVLPAVIFLGAAGAWLGWQHRADERRWTRLRPDLPAPSDDTAPGLDARLAQCAAGFAKWPVDLAALAEFTLLCHANGRPAEAIRGYEALLVLQPAEPRWPHLLAGILTGYGRMDEAMPLLRLAASLSPAQPIVWQRLGDTHLKANQLPEATRAYERVLALRTADIHALFGLARVDLQAGRLTDARRRLQEATLANPDFPGAQTLLATVFERLGNPAAAQAARQRVRGDGRYMEAPDPWAIDLTAYGHHPYTLLVAASAYSSDGRHREALPLLDRAIALAPQDARLHRQLGNTLVLLGDLAAARPRLEQALALAPGDEKIRTDLIRLLKNLSDHAAAEQVVLAGVAACPPSTAFRFDAARIAAREGRSTEAAALLREVWAREPGLTAAPCELASLLFATGRATEADVVLDKLREQFPDDPAVVTLLVRRGIETGDPRTGGWLRRIQIAGSPVPALVELRQAYYARFGVLP